MEKTKKSRWVKSKQCPKCHSHSVYLDIDENDWYEHCLICGYSTSLGAVK